MKFNFLLPFITAFIIAPALATETPITSEIYTVKNGDWLSKIALRKWGEMHKWEDLWKLNQSIRNPDLIYPGQRLRLLSSGQIEFLDHRLDHRIEASNGAPVTQFRSRSEEWRLLPTQEWEKFNFPKDEVVDPLGFDRRSKVQKRFVNQSPMTSTIATDRLAVHGEITYARTEYEHIFLGDQVFIRADEALQVGSIYSVTTGPEKVRSTRDGRVGFIYDLVGKVKIIGVRDGTFIGTVIELNGFLARGNLLIPEVKQVEFKKPIASPSIIAASVLYSEKEIRTLTAENTVVFLDVGSADGVAPGMIFRYYLHKDPYSGKEIATADYLIETEMMITDVKEQFSSAMLMTGRGNLPHDAQVLSLTDLTDFKKHMGMQTNIQDATPRGGADDLDALDTNQGLGEKEENELKQLENVDNPDEIKRVNPSTTNGSTIPGIGDEPAPNDSNGVPPSTAPEPTNPLDEPAAPAVEEIPAAPVEEPAAAITDPLDEPAPAMPPAQAEPLQNPADLAPAPVPAPVPEKPAIGPVPTEPSTALPDFSPPTESLPE